ncbi:MAG: hypothetical protein DRJ05_04710, partial [Bacteroidetes bacterium]
NTFEIEDGGGILTTDLSHLVDDADADPANEFNTSFVLNGNLLELEDDGSTLSADLSSLVDDADADPTNELQNLSINGNDLSITGGNSVTIPSGADNLGNHTATQNVKLNGNWLSNDGGNEGVFVKTDGNVGIGVASPAQKLDVDGKIAVKGEQVIYNASAENSDFEGTLIIGDGGQFLSHTVGEEAQRNTFVGIDAGNGNTKGRRNTFVGKDAGSYNTNGYRNTFIGDGAGVYNQTGNDNTSIGLNSGFENISGSENTTLGLGANHWNETGSRNTIIGYEAGAGNSGHSKSDNIFLGYKAGYDELGSDKLYIENTNSSTPLIYGDFNTDSLAINGSLSIKEELIDASGDKGSSGQLLSSTGTSTDWIDLPDDGDWTVSGYDMYSVKSGNVGIGTSSPSKKLHIDGGDILLEDTYPFLYLNTSSGDNGGINFQNTGDTKASIYWDGNDNKIILSNDDAGIRKDITIKADGKVGIGTSSPTHQLDVGGKIAIKGTQTIYNAETENSDFEGTLIIGDGGTMLSHTSAYEAQDNTFVGLSAGIFNSTGNDNTFIGNQAGRSNETGTNNIYLGSGAGLSNTGGNKNIFIGMQSGHNNNNGSENIFMGFLSGFFETGSNKLYIENSSSNTPLIYGDFDTDSLAINGSLSITDELIDASGDVGTSGQVLSSTGTATNWINLSDDNDWTVSGNNMYSAVSGNVGIGTNNPAEKLDVDGKIAIKGNPTIYNAWALDADFEGTMIVGDGGDNLSHTSGDEAHNNTFFGFGAGTNNTTGYKNTFIGRNAGANNLSGYHNVLLGESAGYLSTGSDNIFIGHNAGYGETGSNKLYIDNSNTSTPLIYGDFDTDELTINGGLRVIQTDNTPGSGINAKYNLSGNEGSLASDAYGVFGNLVSTDLGDYAIYGYGTDASSESGDSYAYGHTLGGVKGYNYYGNPYTFGTAGFSYLDYNRSGGAFGGNYGGSVWGSMAYKNSSGATYGGYFTSSTTGTGKGSNTKVNNGIGVYGELFGANIHGDIYGTYTEGENYAMYSNGTVYKNGLDVHLQKDDKGENQVLYTNVSTDATVQTMGYATISSGKATIVFDGAFTQIVSDGSPIIVTATPTGESKGVYVTNVNKNGFALTENDNGKSNVTVSYIAIGKRKGHESPQLAQEVIAADYTSKLEKGLHNDNDMSTDGKGLYYENGQLNVGKHRSTLPDMNKPAQKED